jgi:tRNA A-37 threonylcarbamoyl transferase component Bud32
MPKTPPRDIKTGDLIAGRYEVRGAVGRGGMGRIYRVYDRILGEELALKTLLPDHVEDKIVLERFFNEARIARSLSHPNVIRVHDIGQADGTVYISMELLKGKSLRQMLDLLQPGQRLPIAGILRMFDALCAALDYAHHFTVHRDIKPENVMILTDGSVKLMDFGISKLKSNPNLTSASIVMGTPHYMAPEQLRNTSTVDARADIYSVGVMLYEVITGDRPTGLAKPASKLRGEVPAALDPIIEKCCQPDPNKRFQSAGELRSALRAVRIDIEQKSSSGESSSASVGSARSGARGGRRYSLAAISFVAILAIAAGGLRWAETRRQELLAAAPSGLATLPLPDTGVAEDPAAQQFAALAARMESLQARAGEAKVDYSEDQQSRIIDGILALGRDLWAESESLARNDPSSALQVGWDAAACFLAVAHWPADMVFVPPSGPGEPRASGAFVDVRPVTIGEFETFAAAQSWPWPSNAFREPTDAPMTGAAYFDAQAYLASASPARQLPSAFELARALDAAAVGKAVQEFGAEPATDESALAESDDPDAPRPTRIAYEQLYVPGRLYGVAIWYEWTSSIDYRGSTEAPMFGDDVLTVAARWTVSDTLVVTRDQAWRYEWSNESLGFRGKVDLPRSIEELDQFESSSL